MVIGLSLEESLWFCWETIMTIGLGDLVPQTEAGSFLAVRGLEKVPVTLETSSHLTQVALPRMAQLGLQLRWSWVHLCSPPASGP